MVVFLVIAMNVFSAGDVIISIKMSVWIAPLLMNTVSSVILMNACNVSKVSI